MYEKEIQALNMAEEGLDKSLIQHQRTLYGKARIDELRQSRPGIPEDYLSYLAEVGAGGIRNELFTIFGEPMEVEEFFEEELHEFLDSDEMVLLFGCDASGNGLLFLTDEEWQVGIIYLDDLGEIVETEQDFRSFISEAILD